MRRSSRTRLPEGTYILGDTHKYGSGTREESRPRDEYGEEKKRWTRQRRYAQERERQIKIKREKERSSK